jgi:predicted RNA-binding Zn-ribbon protein involved in translation (DUF1610 family)
MKCVSCGASIESGEDWVKFPCPACLKEEIVRCEKCKRLVNPYTCKCGFTGP